MDTDLRQLQGLGLPVHAAACSVGFGFFADDVESLLKLIKPKITTNTGGREKHLAMEDS